MSELDNAHDYYHCKIEQTSNGVLELVPMPYRPAPFPKGDVRIDTCMKHDALKKVWAISSNGKYTFFSNENTDFNLVCCEINDKTTHDDRVNEKLSKGYEIDCVINTFDADKRNLV